MLLDIEKLDEPRGLRLAGELDASNAEQLVEALEPEVDVGGDLTLDLAGLAFMDSIGIRVLLRTAQRLEGKGKLVLLSPGQLVRRTLDLIGGASLPNLDIVDEPSL